MAMNERRAVTGMPGISVAFEMKKFSAMLDKFLGNMAGPKGAIGLLKVGLDLIHMFIKTSPVDTGRFRAAWYFSEQGLLQLIRQGGGHKPQSSDEAAGFALGRLKTGLTGWRKYIEITNAVAYAMPLEFGWSTQAPYGVVRVGMMLVQRSFPNHILAELQDMWNRDGVPRYTPWRASSGGPLSIRPRKARKRP
jgi:hypothetical protein